MNLRELTADWKRADLEAYASGRALAVPTPHGLLTRVLGRYKFYAYAEDLSLTPCLAMDGFWESWITLFFLRRVQPGWAVIDVGANFGYYSVLFGELVGPQGRVYALEPLADNYRLLCLNVYVNGSAAWTHTDNVAAGAFADKATIYRKPFHYGGAAIATKPPWTGSEIHSEEVEVFPLDNLEITYGNPVDLLKIDAEGMDPEVFQGAQELRRKNPKMIIVLEYDPDNYARYVAFLEEAERDYAMSVIGPAGYPIRATASAVLGGPFANILLEPK